MLFAALTTTAVVFAAEPCYVDAQRLTHLGKLCKTTNPYHRVEVEAYPELTAREAALLKYTAGEAILFETNSSQVWVRAKYGIRYPLYAMPLTATCGYNLYIENEKGEWQWAASRVPGYGITKEGKDNLERPLQMVRNLPEGTKRCLLYLPIFAELKQLEIGVDEGATIAAVENPFRHKIAVFGSSYTQGHGATNAGQTYPAFLQRQTGFDIINFGMSGNSKLQPVMAEILASTDADAFLLDAFSNPNSDLIRNRIHPFIQTIRAKHPKTPLIFMRTLYCEVRAFDTVRDQWEVDRNKVVDSLMSKIVKQYDDVYFIDMEYYAGEDHMTSADGTHPMSWGYKRWADAIEKPLVKILKKHGIK